MTVHEINDLRGSGSTDISPQRWNADAYTRKVIGVDEPCLASACPELRRFEEAHILLSRVMEDVGEQLPYRAVVEWWLERNRTEMRDAD